MTELQRVEPAMPNAEALGEFTGRFVSEEAETTLGVAVESNRLVIRRRPGLVTPLTPVYADTFTGNLGWVVFRRDSAGRIEALSLGQERLWDLRFSRSPVHAPQAPSSPR